MIPQTDFEIIRLKTANFAVWQAVATNFYYGVIDTDEIEKHPIQFELLPGAGRNKNRGVARSIHGHVGPPVCRAWQWLKMRDLGKKALHTGGWATI